MTLNLVWPINIIILMQVTSWTLWMQEILEARGRAKPHIWTIRTPEEASSHWKKLYGHLDKPEWLRSNTCTTSISLFFFFFLILFIYLFIFNPFPPTRPWTYFDPETKKFTQDVDSIWLEYANNGRGWFLNCSFIFILIVSLSCG